MAVTVRVPGPLRRLTDGKPEVEVEGTTVGQALVQLDELHPGFKQRLYDDSGQLRQFINIYLNDSDIRFGQGLETPVAENDEPVRAARIRAWHVARQLARQNATPSRPRFRLPGPLNRLLGGNSR